MKNKPPLTAVLDANVLYPAPLRDFLLHLAAVGLFEPKWTSSIHAEWIENLLQKRPDLKRKNLEKTRLAMEGAFPEASITDYENLIQGLTLPDPNDRHVLAATIAGNSTIIVTFNTKDFPNSYLKKFGKSAIHPDIFISMLLKLDKKLCFQAFENQVASLKNPPKTRMEVLLYLQKCGLSNIFSVFDYQRGE
jgi:predicted nucleic acid-binding protein